MPDNPTNVDNHWFALPDHQLLTMTGTDAAKFAQAQFMNDVAALPAGHWHWNGWLTPKGRVIALFALLKFDDETLWLLCADGDAQALADGLRRFVFRAKVALAVRDDLHVAGRFEACAASGAVIAGDAAAGVELDLSGDGGPRSLRISADGGDEDVDPRTAWDAFDLRHGLPRLVESQREQWTPQQLSLARLNAYSVKKGCYPGQEIVARTHFLGQAKRRLALLATDGEVTPGKSVDSSGQRVGDVVSVATGVALAVMGDVDGSAQLQVDGVATRRDNLLAGLARQP